MDSSFPVDVVSTDSLFRQGEQKMCLCVRCDIPCSNPTYTANVCEGCRQGDHIGNTARKRNIYDYTEAMEVEDAARYGIPNLKEATE